MTPSIPFKTLLGLTLEGTLEFSPELTHFSVFSLPAHLPSLALASVLSCHSIPDLFLPGGSMVSAERAQTVE